MPYVERDKNGVMIGIYANRQDGYAEEFLAEAALPAPVAVTRYSKRALFAAMTDDEYAVFAAVEAQQPPRSRRIFAEAQELIDCDQDFGLFEALMSSAFGDDRAAALIEAARL